MYTCAHAHMCMHRKNRSGLQIQVFIHSALSVFYPVWKENTSGKLNLPSFHFTNSLLQLICIFAIPGLPLPFINFRCISNGRDSKVDADTVSDLPPTIDSHTFFPFIFPVFVCQYLWVKWEKVWVLRDRVILWICVSESLKLIWNYWGYQGLRQH